ncbi:MAG: hypothetical protein A2428_10140 [Bdellovibrionales bacterium RIFOXYC1_FULL_54_43]|nr:MAG: hypothetical protein A2428_10140 [Bdellovibrionales bacterium RIFOXYC1_FULL_54_43]OFZ80542.1 MAG: hypothetical protein A2603_13235 [Bdellovibrionales bacterium RIFOXYD1_FULL_55_31]
MKILKPKALRRGDTLGIVACSTPIQVSNESTIERCYSYFREKGFKIAEAPNCRKTFGHTAGTIKERVAALHQFFRDNKIDGILSYWGGFQSHQLLEYIDYDLIRKNPKPFIGFSDTTALNIALYSQAGLINFSGPAGITFGKPTVPSFTWQHFEDVLMNGNAAHSFQQSKEYSDNPWWQEESKRMLFKPNLGWKVYRNGFATGKLIGGNLGTLLLLAGTKYWPKLKGSILFVEDDEAESPKTMDRMFIQLRHMGVYDQISGMIVGRFHSAVQFKDDDSLEIILDDALKGYRFPIITNVDFGHTDPLLTIPVGARCTMDTKKPRITLNERAVNLK